MARKKDEVVDVVDVVEQPSASQKRISISEFVEGDVEALRTQPALKAAFKTYWLFVVGGSDMDRKPFSEWLAEFNTFLTRPIK